MKDEVYIFFHITKTAGTSLRAMLYTYFLDGEYEPNKRGIYVYSPKWDTRPLVLTEKNKDAKYFIGHLVYYGMHEVIGKPAKYIAFLRNPLERFVSLYNHVRINSQLKTLEFVDWFKLYKSFTMVNELVSCSNFSIPSLDQAKFILKNCSFIGLQDTFETDTKQLFNSYIDILYRNITEKNAKNAGVEVLKFTNDEIDIVKEVLAEDFQLYEYAIQLRKMGYNEGFSLPFNSNYQI
jgi:hypothetical protein